MFSPDSTIHAGRTTSLRRRRQRDSDGLRQPQRKRNKLSDDAHTSPPSRLSNGKGSISMNGHASHGESDSLVFVDVPMPVREKKPIAKRATKEENGTFLVSSR